MAKTKEKKEAQTTKKDRMPIFVVLIAILFFLNFIALIFILISLIFNLTVITNYFFSMPMGGQSFKIVVMIALFLFSLFNLFIARGLLMAKNWARIVVIILGFLSILTGIVSAIIGIAIALYLLLSKNVKDVFRKNK